MVGAPTSLIEQLTQVFRKPAIVVFEDLPRQLRLSYVATSILLMLNIHYFSINQSISQSVRHSGAAWVIGARGGQTAILLPRKVVTREMPDALRFVFAAPPDCRPGRFTFSALLPTPL